MCQNGQHTEKSIFIEPDKPEDHHVRKSRYHNYRNEVTVVVREQGRGRDFLASRHEHPFIRDESATGPPGEQVRPDADDRGERSAYPNGSRETRTIYPSRHFPILRPSPIRPITTSLSTWMNASLSRIVPRREPTSCSSAVVFNRCRVSRRGSDRKTTLRMHGHEWRTRKIEDAVRS